MFNVQGPGLKDYHDYSDRLPVPAVRQQRFKRISSPPAKPEFHQLRSRSKDFNNSELLSLCVNLLNQATRDWNITAFISHDPKLIIILFIYEHLHVQFTT